MFVLINIWFWFFSVFLRYWLIVQGDSSLTAHPRPRNRINYTHIRLSSLACEGWSDAHNSRQLRRPREGCGDVEEERERDRRTELGRRGVRVRELLSCCYEWFSGWEEVTQGQCQGRLISGKHWQNKVGQPESHLTNPNLKIKHQSTIYETKKQIAMCYRMLMNPSITPTNGPNYWQTHLQIKLIIPILNVKEFLYAIYTFIISAVNTG